MKQIISPTTLSLAEVLKATMKRRKRSRCCGSSTLLSRRSLPIVRKPRSVALCVTMARYAGELERSAAESCAHRSMGRDDGESAHLTGCFADTLAAGHVLYLFLVRRQRTKIASWVGLIHSPLSIRGTNSRGNSLLAGFNGDHIARFNKECA
jgi:hypothetical protein